VLVQELDSVRRAQQGEFATLQAAHQQLAAKLASTKEQLEGHVAELTDEVGCRQTSCSCG
jgi:hypothetical protein